MTASRAIGAEPGNDGSTHFAERLLPLGDVGVNDLLVQVTAVSINPVDTKLAASVTGFRVLGFDAVGTVIAVGARVSRFVTGDRVFYAGSLDRPGSNQTFQLVDERIAALAPALLTAPQAASLPLTAITAWESLFDKFRLTADVAGTMLVVGAAGGVGSALIQLSKALLPGVSVIGTASRPESQRWVRNLGADHVINQAELVNQLARIAPSGIDWILSAWSQGRIDEYARILRPYGEVVGIDSGPIDVTALKAKSASWHWEYMFTRSNPLGPDDDQHRQILSAVAKLVHDGLIRSTEAVVLHGLSVETLAEAHRLVASGTTIGKVVISLE